MYLQYQRLDNVNMNSVINTSNLFTIDKLEQCCKFFREVCIMDYDGKSENGRLWDKSKRKVHSSSEVEFYENSLDFKKNTKSDDSCKIKIGFGDILQSRKRRHIPIESNNLNVTGPLSGLFGGRVEAPLHSGYSFQSGWDQPETSKIVVAARNQPDVVKPDQQPEQQPIVENQPISTVQLPNRYTINPSDRYEVSVALLFDAKFRRTY